MLMDVHQRGNLRFPQSLPEFQRLFPDDAACAAYLEKARWSDGFVCPHCQAAGEPFRFANRPGVLRCRKCRRDTGLTVGTVMARLHTPLSVWFWSAYLVSSQTPGVSAVQLRRQLGLSRYETAFQILHKLRAGMVRPDQDRIGGRPGEHVEVDETLPIRLSPTATSGSVQPCSWTFTSVAIFGSHNRSQSSSDFFPTTRPAPPTWRRLAGATGLFAPIVRRRESRSASQIVLASCAAASAAVTPD